MRHYKTFKDFLYKLSPPEWLNRQEEKRLALRKSKEPTEIPKESSTVAITVEKGGAKRRVFPQGGPQ